LLPQDVQAAATMAKRHDNWMKERAWMKTEEQGPLRHSLEVRHASFATAEFIELLRKYNVALVCADTKEWPRMMDITSDFLYCRLHGSEAKYAGGYDDQALDEWAARVMAWAQGQEPAGAERVIPKAGPKLASRDVFVYFDNETKVRSPMDAQGLMKRVDQALPAAPNRRNSTRAR
jgi:uncharacterized protein YecE (DUF72 family)